MFKGLMKIVLDLIVGTITIINDFISALTSGSFLKWPAIILSKWKHLLGLIVIFSLVSYLYNMKEAAFTLGYLLTPWDYLTKGYSETKDYIEKEADEAAKEIIKEVS